MGNIPNKLQKQYVNHKCKGAHKFRRFSKNNKTYRLDVYFCANCGHTVKIEQIFGHESLCWRCEEPFNIPAGMTKLMPTCIKCTPKDYKRILDISTKHVNPENPIEWIDNNEEPKVERIDKDKFVEDLLKDAKLIL